MNVVCSLLYQAATVGLHIGKRSVVALVPRYEVRQCRKRWNVGAGSTARGLGAAPRTERAPVGRSSVATVSRGLRVKRKFAMKSCGKHGIATSGRLGPGPMWKTLLAMKSCGRHDEVPRTPAHAKANLQAKAHVLCAARIAASRIAASAAIEATF